MKIDNEIVAIIPARLGSKGIKEKNIKLLNGIPLIAYTILAAKKCPYIKKCIVSTESEKIKNISLYYGAEVIDRPVDLAEDTSSSSDVVLHTLNKLRSYKYYSNYFVLLQPTSPLRNDMHLSECIELFFKKDASCAISVTEVSHHPYKYFDLYNNELKPLFSESDLNKPRQLLPKVYRQNGAIYLLNTESFLKTQSFFEKGAIPYIMSEEVSIDIDTNLDFVLCEEILKSRTRSIGR